MVDVGEDSIEEREFLGRMREESALPEYSLFGDYVEMMIQFGYVALFSAIWPVASATSFINNFVRHFFLSISRTDLHG